MMKKQFLSTILALTMMASAVPGVLAEDTYVDVREIHVELADYYLNADYIGLADESTTVENYRTNNVLQAWEHDAMLDGSVINNTEDGVVSVKRRYSHIVTGGNPANQWVQTEDVTTFKIDKSSVNAGVLDSINVVKGKSYTIPLSGRPVDEISFLTYCFGSHVGGTINYTNGDKDTFNGVRGVGNNIGMYASSVPYAGTNSESLAYITKTDDKDFVIARSSGVIGGLGLSGQYLMASADGTLKGHTAVRAEELAQEGATSTLAENNQTIGMFAISATADPAKQIESITFNADGGVEKTAIFAVTEATLSNAEMLDYIADVDLSDPVANIKNIETAVNYINELETYRGYTETSEFANIKKIYEDTLWYAGGYDVKYDMIDIFDNNYELSDFLGKVGDAPEVSEWGAGGKFTFSKYAVDTPAGATGTAAAAGYRIDNMGETKTTGILKINEVAAVGTSNGWSAQKTGNEVEFYLPIEGQEGGVPDSVVLSDTHNTDGVTIPVGDKLVDELYIFAPVWTGTVSMILNYTDGTSESLKTPGFNQNFPSCWGDGNFYNRAYKIWNEAQTEYSVNANKMGLVGQFSSFANQYLVIGTEGMLVNAKDVCETTGNQTLGISAFGADVDETKKLASVTFPASNRMAVLALTTRVKTNDEMKAYLSSLDLNEEPAALAPKLELAMNYIEELEIRHTAKREEYPDIVTAYENSKWYAQGVEGGEKYVDISEYFNADMIGDIGQTYNPDIIMGLNDGSVMSTGTTIKNNAGILTFNEKYAYVETDAWTDIKNADGNNKTFTMSLPVAGADAGVKDAIVINKDTTPDGVTIDIDNEAVEYIRIAMDSRDTMSAVANVNYTDGTCDSVVLPVRRMASVIYDGGRKDRAFYNEADNTLGYAEAINGGIISWYNLKAAKVDEATTTIVDRADGTNGIFVNQIKTDKTKITDSITITLNNSKSIGIVALNVVTISNDELKETISKVDELAGTIGYITTQEDVELVKTAAEYAKLLDTRHIRKLDDKANNNVFGMMKQIKYTEGGYMDLTQYLNADIIVADGDKIPEAYESERSLFYKGSRVPADGIIRMVKQNSADIVVDDTETGRIFKLNGDYTKVGNDSIKVAKDGEAFVLPLEGTNYTDMAFIIDALWASNGAGSGYSSIDVTVTYKDGTTEDVKLRVWTPDGYYVPQFFAHSEGNYQRTVANTETGYYEDEPVVSGKNGTYMFSSPVTLDSNKQAESITFKPSNGDYYILAGTTDYVSNDAVVEKMFKYFDLNLKATSEVTLANAKTVTEGTSALIDLYENRGFDVISGWFTVADYELAKEMNNAAKAYDDVEYDVLSFVPSIEVANGQMTATFDMTNTKDFDQSYVLIAAVYGENDKLLAIKCSEDSVLKSLVIDSKSLTVDVPDGAVSYKAFVWDGLKTMIPIAQAVK